MKKTALKLDSLGVESFATSDAPAADRGTIEAKQADCTSPDTCKCPTSLWACGTIAFTVYSCPPSFDCV